MHELPVAERILNTVLQHASGHDVSKIVVIHLRIGELSDLEDDWLQRYFDYLSKGSKISDAEVHNIMERSGLESEDTVYKMVRVAAEMRTLYENGEIPLAPSIANLICWAQLVVTDNVPVDLAADETIVDTISDDPSIKSTIRRIINSVFVTERTRRPHEPA